MSWRRELREIHQEREKLLRRDERLRTDLRWQFGSALIYLELGGMIVSLVSRIAGGRRRRRSRR